MTTRIRITTADAILNATLRDNPAARDLADRLPLMVNFSDYGGQEVLGALTPELTMQGMPRGESAPAGTIGWYAPGQSLVLYYTDVPRFPGIVRLGEIDGDLSALRGWAEPRPVTIEIAD